MDVELTTDLGEGLPCLVEFSSHLDVVGSEDTASATTTLDAASLQVALHPGAVDLEGSGEQFGGLAVLVAAHQLGHLIRLQPTLHLPGWTGGSGGNDSKVSVLVRILTERIRIHGVREQRG